MSIRCLITSSNKMVHNKMKSFIMKTYFLELFDGDELSFDDGYPMLMFFDVDSFKLGAAYIQKMLLLPIISVFISSTYSKEFISEWLQIDSREMGFLNKTANYEDFLEEISKVIDYTNLKAL